MKKALIIITILGVALVGGLAACVTLVGGTAAVVDQEIKQQEADRKSHVQLAGCQRTVIDSMEVTYTIVNSSDQPQDYALQIDVMKDETTRVGSAIGYEANVLPGAKVQGTAVGNVTGKGKVVCILRDA
jgi:hypothetical protein